MISKKNKVQRDQIPFILEKGLQTKSSFFIVRYQKNDVALPRFCAIISRKVEKSAVKRNRIRRQIFESIRLNLKENENLRILAYDLVLIPKKIVLKKDFHDIKKDISSLLNKWTN